MNWIKREEKNKRNKRHGLSEVEASLIITVIVNLFDVGYKAGTLFLHKIKDRTAICTYSLLLFIDNILTPRASLIWLGNVLQLCRLLFHHPDSNQILY